MTAPTWHALAAWPHATPTPKRSGFRTEWADTLDDLEREVGLVDGAGVVIALCLPADAIAWSGALRPGWNLRTTHPGVEVSFDTPARRVVFHSATYPPAQENLHGIVLKLEALRAIDRWGGGTGEQYAGYAALPADVAVERGRRLVAAAGNDVRAALKAHHPDQGGKDADAAAINAYARTLPRARR